MIHFQTWDDLRLFTMQQKIAENLTVSGMECGNGQWVQIPVVKFYISFALIRLGGTWVNSQVLESLLTI